MVSLVVGSGTPDPAQGFDADDVVSFAVHIAATSGVLPTALNIDDCEAARSRSGRR
jgi:hypothetical protein